MVYSNKHNYILVGPGASGKSTEYAKVHKKAGKLDNIKPEFFAAPPQGLVSYCSINYPVKRLSCLIGSGIKLIVCKCDTKVLRRRLTDRLFRRIHKYKNDENFREAMDIFARNYMYDYAELIRTLNAYSIPYEILDTTG